MVTMTSRKRYALDWTDGHARLFSDFHLRIWNYAEPAWREYKSAKAYCNLLRAEGFAVEEGSGAMPTAFAARWDWTRLTEARTVLYGSLESRRDAMLRKGAEEARNQLPDLLEAAEKGRSTIITRHGRPVAALVPIEAYGAAVRQQPLMPVAGSGRGLWGKDSTRTLRKLRDEWSR